MAAAGTVDMITDEGVGARTRKTPYMVELIQKHQALPWLTLYVLQTHNQLAVPGLIMNQRDVGRRPDQSPCCNMPRKASSQRVACIKVISNTMTPARPSTAHVATFLLRSLVPGRSPDLRHFLWCESPLDIDISSIATIAERCLKVRHDQGINARDG